MSVRISFQQTHLQKISYSYREVVGNTFHIYFENSPSLCLYLEVCLWIKWRDLLYLLLSLLMRKVELSVCLLRLITVDLDNLVLKNRIFKLLINLVWLLFYFHWSYWYILGIGLRIFCLIILLLLLFLLLFLFIALSLLLYTVLVLLSPGRSSPGLFLRFFHIKILICYEKFKN